MKTIAIGPESPYPSWNWVGLHAVEELSKYFQVKIFKSLNQVPKCDVVFILKDICSIGSLVEFKFNKYKIIYMPIDSFNDQKSIVQNEFFLRQFNAILLHCERLEPFFEIYNKNIHFIDHYNKYGLEKMSEYKEKGFILWVGGYQFVPYLFKWIEKNPIKNEIKILTDLDNERAISAARRFASDIGIELPIEKNARSIKHIKTYNWSEKLQCELMKDCKAAIDIKWTEDFCQNHKPPTKSQKYIASGIPFAINKESYSTEYFEKKGFNLATPDDTEKWFSKEYWQETRIFGEDLKKETSSESVGLKYKQIIESL
jgi:hypothetical protein